MMILHQYTCGALGDLQSPLLLSGGLLLLHRPPETGIIFRGRVRNFELSSALLPFATAESLRLPEVFLFRVALLSFSAGLSRCLFNSLINMTRFQAFSMSLKFASLDVSFIPCCSPTSPSVNLSGPSFPSYWMRKLPFLFFEILPGIPSLVFPPCQELRIGDSVHESGDSHAFRRTLDVSALRLVSLYEVFCRFPISLLDVMEYYRVSDAFFLLESMADSCVLVGSLPKRHQKSIALYLLPVFPFFLRSCSYLSAMIGSNFS
ncbi:hypothetical protein Tco_1502926 [Tanacetum coccineum]